MRRSTKPMLQCCGLHPEYGGYGVSADPVRAASSHPPISRDSEGVGGLASAPGLTLPRALELVDRAPTELQELIATMAVALRTGVRDVRFWLHLGQLPARGWAVLRRELRRLFGLRLLKERRP
jgi:hypothetical protein